MLFVSIDPLYPIAMEQLVDQSLDALIPMTHRETSEEQDAIARLRCFIDAGSYAPGDRLPSEREMIAKVGLRRITLRKALDALERDGAIWRHVGKGTFVAQPSNTDSVGVIATLKQKMTPVRMVQARLCIEPSVAREAAIHASREAIARINFAKDSAKAATNWADYEAQDDAFHRAVAEASDNTLLLLLFDQLNHVRRAVADNEVVRRSNRPPCEHSSFAEHESIAQAIEARDPAAAQKAMRAHIGSVSERLFGQD